MLSRLVHVKRVSNFNAGINTSEARLPNHVKFTEMLAFDYDMDIAYSVMFTCY